MHFQAGLTAIVVSSKQLSHSKFTQFNVNMLDTLERKEPFMDDISIASVAAKLPGLHILEPSVVHHEGITYFLARADNGQTHLGVYAPSEASSVTSFQGTTQEI